MGGLRQTQTDRQTDLIALSLYGPRNTKWLVLLFILGIEIWTELVLVLIYSHDHRRRLYEEIMQEFIHFKFSVVRG